MLFGGKPAMVAWGEDGDACMRGGALGLGHGRERAGRTDVLVETETNVRRTPVRSNGSPLGRCITRWSA